MILDMVVGGVIGWFKDKSAIKKAKVEGEIKAIHNASQNTADWEQLHAKGSQTSWKDEFWTLVFSVPLIMGFVPGGEVYTARGFEALSTMPEWYQYTLVTMVLASFGIKMSGSVKKMLGK
jgi:hypothetical protein